MCIKKERKKASKREQTKDRGKISARRCLYLLTGCLDLALKAGQKQHKLSHTGKTVLETTPIISLFSSTKKIKTTFTDTWLVRKWWNVWVKAEIHQKKTNVKENLREKTKKLFRKRGDNCGTFIYVFFKNQKEFESYFWGINDLNIKQKKILNQNEIIK